ncbi:hypothetical protein F2P56_033999 [Juglans regia]|uniref:Uncharacterized protein LOC108990363 n=2 Tax=Juglans regia TaxID=51240 RepID=A0A2I4EKD9_JUGRE|nr:uncharacterized protein LOC108990363 [Juglans regia]KAF5444907.1 hypothetical protein F2P56_033999 [Juglans regia]
MELLKEGTVWRIGNGASTKIWKDKWLPRPVTYQIQTPPNTLDLDSRLEVLIDVESRSWKKDLVAAVFKEEEAECSKKGTFSVKSAYLLATTLKGRHLGEGSKDGGTSDWWKALWLLEVSGKVKLFIWKCLNNILPTKDNLFRKQIVDNNLYPICIREVETSVHTIWVCPAAADVWGGENIAFSKWRRHYLDFQLLWIELVNLFTKENLDLASILMYHLWARRNAFIFQNQFSQPGSVLAKAQSELSLFREYNTVNKIRAEDNMRNRLTATWKPPNQPFVKVNFDAAFNKTNGRMGMEIVIKDHAGNLHVSLTASMDNTNSVFQAEGEALYRAMDLCLELGLYHVIFEGDAKVVIDAVNFKKEDNMWLGQLTEVLQQFLVRNLTWILNFVHRQANKVAHTAAQLAISNVNECFWLDDGPPEVKSMATEDLICMV